MADPAADGAPAPVITGWIVFFTGVLAAAALDVFLVSRTSPQAQPHVPVYARQIAFWMVAGLLFSLFVWSWMGRAAAGGWLYGYVLEYLLSFDNLFVFQMVFRAYSTPAAQVDRALFWGICVAVALRLLFFGIGTEILQLGFVARCIFGLALVYSGVKSVRNSEDDEADPRQNPLVQCATHVLPVHDGYSEDGAFFIRVFGDPAQSGASPLPSALGSPSGVELDAVGAEHPRDSASEAQYAIKAGGRGGRLRVTLLFLVVLTLAIIDVVFAVDSVTAKLSSINGYGAERSFFLNLTSSALAMFVLRSLYVIMDTLVHMFRFLNYGVGLVLILIGAKLMLSGFVDVSLLVSCLAILAILLASVLASVLVPAPAPRIPDTPSSDLPGPTESARPPDVGKRLGEAKDPEL